MENAIMVAAALISAGLVAGLAAIGASLGDAIVTSRFIEACKKLYIDDGNYADFLLRNFRSGVYCHRYFGT